jgi:calcineurin-like phosphoesterase family protein
VSNTFLTSDLHLGHKNICVFTNFDGSKVRPWDDVDEMNEAIIANWNSVVKVHDKVYVLGDVVMNKKYLPLMDRLNGSKRLIRGNHDIFPTKEYLKYFTEIYGVRVLSDMILSHIPLHNDCITARFNVNVHGHLHNNDLNSPLHFNVCLERTNFTPISIEDLRLQIQRKENEYHSL